MYAMLWRKLPGPAWARVLTLLMGAAIVLIALFEWGFPWVSSLIPIQDQTVQEGG